LLGFWGDGELQPSPRANAKDDDIKQQQQHLFETITSNRNGGVTNSLLVITGGMGAGKTSILGEASDLLAMRQIAHAAIDLDALGLAWLPSTPDGAMYSNLRSVCENYAAL
jgi:hypothetical protein